ncbi:MAG: NUDIX hydrolase [Deferrisomatales bacterium]|nr:NUDIX hydrolase [Deferrisomatales bacterium]
MLPGGRTLPLEVVRHPGGAAAVAVDHRGRVCLLRQFRHAVGGWLWEIPAGKLDPGETPERTARRELEEEAGVRAGTWLSLGQIVTAPGFCDEVIHLFLAQDLETGNPRPEDHEVLEVHWVDLGEALRRAAGELRDAKTVAGLFRAREALRR